MGRPEASQPYAIIALVAFDVHVRTMCVPEEWIPRVTAHGWTVLIRDSDMPPPLPRPSVMDMHLLSGQNRRSWLNESDVHDDNGANEPDED